MINKPLNQLIKTKKPIIGFVEEDVFKDGSTRYVSTTKMPLINENGDVVGTFGISRDKPSSTTITTVAVAVHDPEIVVNAGNESDVRFALLLQLKKND